MAEIELIARAVIKRGDEILLANKHGEINTFLPGGHIEDGEYAEEALRRELLEELGVESRITGFIGVLEHKFTDRHGHTYEEINLVFEAEIERDSADSAEGHLEFLWVKLAELEKHTLLPSSLPMLLEKWEQDRATFYYAQRS